MLRIAERQVAPDITVVELSGRLALGGDSQSVETLVDELVTRGSKRVVLDMSGLDSVDSTGISVVALAAGRMRQAGGKLAVVATPEGRVSHLLHMTQMNAIVNVAPDATAAIASV